MDKCVFSTVLLEYNGFKLQECNKLHDKLSPGHPPALYICSPVSSTLLLQPLLLPHHPLSSFSSLPEGSSHPGHPAYQPEEALAAVTFSCSPEGFLLSLYLRALYPGYSVPEKTPWLKINVEKKRLTGKFNIPRNKDPCPISKCFILSLKPKLIPQWASLCQWEHDKLREIFEPRISNLGQYKF